MPTPGPMTSPPTPRWIMDLWSLPWVRKIYLCWAPRTAKTNTALSCLLYAAEPHPASAMYVMPVEYLAKSMMKDRIRPTIKAMPALAALMLGSYDTTSTLLALSNGAQIRVTWATSEAMLSSEDVRYMIIDEADKEQYSPSKGPNPLLTAEVRTATIPGQQETSSSPPLRGPVEHVGRPPRQCDVVDALEVRCPTCGRRQIMSLERVTWPETKDYRRILREKSARYRCEGCDAFEANHWDDHTRNEAVRLGRWVPGRINEDDEWEVDPSPPLRPTAIGAWLPGWCSPDASLSAVAACAIRAKDDIKYEMKLASDYCAKPWKNRVETVSEVGLLAHCTARPSGIVPPGSLVLTCGVDVQKIGFWFVIRAWFDDFTSHKIMHGFVTTFDDLEKVIFDTRFRVEGSKLAMPIWRAMIDTGGSLTESQTWTRTEEIYDWLHRKGRGMVFGAKGASRAQLPGGQALPGRGHAPHARPYSRGP